MKKFLSLAFVFVSLMAMTSTASGQGTGTPQNPVFGLSKFKFSPTLTNTTSTVTNTGADTVSLNLPGYYDIVGLQPVFTKASGTAAGTVVFYGSINGVNYVPTGDTLTLTNVTTNTTIFTKSKPIYVYYRAVQSGATTVSGTLNVYYTARRL